MDSENRFLNCLLWVFYRTRECLEIPISMLSKWRRFVYLYFLIHFSLKCFKDLRVVTVYTCLKIYLYKKALFNFVSNVTFSIMGLLNMLQIHGFVYS